MLNWRRCIHTNVLEFWQRVDRELRARRIASEFVQLPGGCKLIKPRKWQRAGSAREWASTTSARDEPAKPVNSTLVYVPRRWGFRAQRGFIEESKTMIDIVRYEAQLRYRAKRLGYSVMQTRGLENLRRETSGNGTFVLLWPRQRGPACRHVERHREVFTGS